MRQSRKSRSTRSVPRRAHGTTSSHRIRRETPRPAPSRKHPGLNSPSREFPVISSDELERIVDENRSLRRLHEIIAFLGSSASLDELLPEIVDLGMKLSGLNRGLLAITHDDGYDLRVCRGWLRSERQGVGFKLCQRFLGEALARGRPIFKCDLQEDIRIRSQRRQVDLSTLVVLPLKVDGQLVGALLLAGEAEREEFDSNEQQLYKTFAQHAALSLQRRSDEASRQNESDRTEASRVDLERRLNDAEDQLGELGEAISNGSSLRSAKEAFYRAYLESSLQRNQGSLTKTAREARISRRDLVKLLERYKILPRSGASHRLSRVG